MESSRLRMRKVGQKRPDTAPPDTGRSKDRCRYLPMCLLKKLLISAKVSLVSGALSSKR